MLIEALFWFHPLVWWIERRMIDERERACDEAVLNSGTEPSDYAESLLEVCRGAVASPLAGVAGLSGSDLRRRIESIVLGSPGRPLTLGKRLALGGIAATVSTLPVLAGALQTPVEAVDPNLRFELASIRLPDPSSGIVMLRTLPGRFEAVNVPVRLLVRQALRMPEDRIIGVPGWADSERYTINAKMPDGALPSASPAMLTNLLRERFGLATHTETRELPVFHLVLARSDRRLGPKLRQSSADCQAAVASRGGGAGSPPATDGLGRVALPGTPGGPPLFDPDNPACGSGRSGPGIIGGGGRPIAQIVQMLSQILGRPVVDKTGLAGIYDFTLLFMTEPGMGMNPFGLPPPAGAGTPPPVDPNAPNLFTALQEQLGLKLESRRDGVEVVVVDRLERPTLLD